MFSPRVKAAISPVLLSRLALQAKPNPPDSRPDLLEIPELKGITPGLPRGSINEICGGQSSGKTTLLLSIASRSTRRDKAVAIVDLCNSLDPASARSAGLMLENLLWIRCGGNLDAAMKAVDILLQGGGFELVVLDAADFCPEPLHKIPMMYWFRFRRAAEATRTILLVLSTVPIAGSCSSTVIKVKNEAIGWEGNSGFRLLHAWRSSLQVQKRPKFVTAGKNKPGLPPARSIS